MNVIRRKIDKFLNTPIEIDEEELHRRIRLIAAITGLIGAIVTGSIIINGLISDMKEKTGDTQSEGKIIECTKVTNNTIWSFIGFQDSTEYKTIIEVNNKILEDTNKEIYYLCKDKINQNINLEIETYEGNPSRISKVIDNN